MAFRRYFKREIKGSANHRLPEFESGKPPFSFGHTTGELFHRLKKWELKNTLPWYVN